MKGWTGLEMEDRQDARGARRNGKVLGKEKVANHCHKPPTSRGSTWSALGGDAIAGALCHAPTSLSVVSIQRPTWAPPSIVTRASPKPYAPTKNMESDTTSSRSSATANSHILSPCTIHARNHARPASCEPCRRESNVSCGVRTHLAMKWLQ